MTYDEAISIIERERPDVWTSGGVADLLASCSYRFAFPQLVKIKALLDDDVFYALALNVSELSTAEKPVIIRRMAADPTGWATNDEGLASARQLDTFNQWFEPEACSQIWACSMAMSRIRDEQLKLGISCLSDHSTHALFGHRIELSQPNWMMATPESDIAAIKRNALLLLEFFWQATAGHRHQYDAFEEMEEFVEYSSIDASVIQSLKPQVLTCSLSATCSDWVPCDDGNFSSIPCDRDPETDPDEIRLALGLGDRVNELGETPDYRVFIFEHKDKSRFPWKES